MPDIRVTDLPSGRQGGAPAAELGYAAAETSTRLTAEHHQETALLQRMVDRVTAIVARPWFVTVLAPTMVLWLAINGAAALAGYHSIDMPPFNGLQTALAVMGVSISALILSTQRRQDQLSSHREQLLLELAVLNDQKLSKMIALLEELRRDTPTVADRIDRTAKAMSTPADPKIVLDAIKSSTPGDVP